MCVCVCVCLQNTLETCTICSKPIMERILRATGKAYHPHCFTCVVCHRSLDGVPFTVDASNQIHCIEDFHKLVPFILPPPVARAIEAKHRSQMKAMAATLPIARSSPPPRTQIS